MSGGPPYKTGEIFRRTDEHGRNDVPDMIVECATKDAGEDQDVIYLVREIRPPGCDDRRPTPPRLVGHYLWNRIRKGKNNWPRPHGSNHGCGKEILAAYANKDIGIAKRIGKRCSTDGSCSPASNFRDDAFMRHEMRSHCVDDA